MLADNEKTLSDHKVKISCLERQQDALFGQFQELAEVVEGVAGVCETGRNGMNSRVEAVEKVLLERDVDSVVRRVVSGAGLLQPDLDWGLMKNGHG